MKKIIFILLILISRFSFGQNRPGEFGALGVQPFHPEIISKLPNVRDLAISPSGNEIFFTVQSYLGELSTLVFIKKENDQWTNPEVASFSGRYRDLEPFFSTDGLKLFFVSNRSLNDSTGKPKDFDIWYVQRKNSDRKWSEPVNLGAPVNTEHDEFYPAISKYNNLYFTSDVPDSNKKDDIYLSKWVNGRYTTPVALDDSINSSGYEFNAYISPEETFLIYTCYKRKDGHGSGDLYISYRKEKGNWTKAKNLGDQINSPKMDYCPFVDLETEKLYFTSKRNRTKQIFRSRQDLEALLNEMKRYDNGLSRIYHVAIGEILSLKKMK